VRFRVALAVIFLGAAGLVSLALFRPDHKDGVAGGAGSNVQAVSISLAQADRSIGKITSEAPESATNLEARDLPPTSNTNSTRNPDPHEVYISSRVAQLQDLSMQNDAASLDAILFELSNTEPEIRKAAVDAATQFGSRDAIPRLLDAAGQTDDLKENAALNDAAEFLKLPSLTELLAQMKSRGR